MQETKRRECEFNLWIEQIPWRRKWQPAPVFLPGESHGQGSLAGYSPWGRKESNTTEVTQHACIFHPPQHLLCFFFPLTTHLKVTSCKICQVHPKILWCFLLCYFYICNKILLLHWVELTEKRKKNLFACIYSIRHNFRRNKNLSRKGMGGKNGEMEGGKPKEASRSLLCRNHVLFISISPRGWALLGHTGLRSMFD